MWAEEVSGCQKPGTLKLKVKLKKKLKIKYHQGRQFGGDKSQIVVYRVLFIMDYIGSEEDTCLQLKFETEFNSAYIQH